MNNPRAIVSILLIAIMTILASCGQNNQPEVVKNHYILMGAFVDIQVVVKPGGEEKARDAMEKARTEMDRLEGLWSPYKPQSDISRINENAGKNPVTVSPETMRVLKKSMEISELSNGAFDITFAPVGELWKLDPDNPHFPSEEELREAMKLVNYRNVILDEENLTAAFRKEGMKMDLGGIAKGSAVDAAIRVLKENGIANALVNAGGDLYAMGMNKESEPWRIGIRDPRNKSEFISTIQVSDQAAVTSGDYERMVEIDGKRYHHILDVKTGRPSEKSISVTVVAPSAETADALSTAIFVLGPEEGLSLAESLPNVEALIESPDQKIHSTDYFKME